MRKKGQTEVYISIALIIIIMTIFLFFSKKKGMETGITQAGTVVDDYTRNYMAVSSQSTPYTTTHGITFEEYLGDYSCYLEDVADYGNGISVNVVDLIRQRFNEIYGPDRWSVIIYKEDFPQIPELPFMADSSGSMTDDIEIIKQIKQIISPESEITNLKDLPSDVNHCWYGESQPDENWAGAAAVLCKKGFPKKVGSSWEYTPWADLPREIPKAIFVSSDEGNCNGLPDQEKDTTPDYFDTPGTGVLDACRENHVKIYFLMPEQVSGAWGPSSSPLNQGLVKAKIEATGGRVIRLSDANQAVTEILSELDIEQHDVFRVQITSGRVLTDKELPVSTSIKSYSIIYPCPCSTFQLCRANVLYYPEGSVQ